MPILSAENLGLSFGAFDLFKGISVTIPNDGKIGLIGPNGIGKTSLLLILAGLNQPTTGMIHIARRRKLGYLRQEAVDAFANRENTVYGEMLTLFTDLQAQQDLLTELEAKMAAGDHRPETLAEYGALQEAFEKAGGYDYELCIQQTLQGLGLDKRHWNMSLRHLSGGQKTRALLARLLLEKPDLLMLDEPTNHLDLTAVEWLENTLQNWGGSILIVSHDRFFLDNTVNTIWEMSQEGIEVYSGSYTAYLMQREERWDYLERVFEEEKARLLKEVDFIERNWVRASTHARALGVLKRVSRDLAVIQNFGIMALRGGKKWIEFGLRADYWELDVIGAIRAVNALSLGRRRPAHIKPHFASANPSGTIVLRANRTTIGYPGHPLFTTGEAELRRGECAALIGWVTSAAVFSKPNMGESTRLESCLPMLRNRRTPSITNPRPIIKSIQEMI